MAARHPKVDVPASKLKTEIARILKEEGYIVELQGGRRRREEDHQDLPEVRARQLAGDLARSSAFRGPAAGCMSAARDIPRVLGGLGINILTTPRGVMTGRRRAKKASAAKFSARSGKRDGKGSYVKSRKKADPAAERCEDQHRRPTASGRARRAS